jgi:hypothetical protein
MTVLQFLRLNSTHFIIFFIHNIHLRFNTKHKQKESAFEKGIFVVDAFIYTKRLLIQQSHRLAEAIVSTSQEQ